MSGVKLRVEWLHKVSTYDIGEEIYLPCESRQERKIILKAFLKDLRILAEINPIKAAQIHVYQTYVDRKFWVVLKKVRHNPRLGYKKSPKGVSIVTLDEKSSRFRRLQAMKEDGLTLEDVQDLMDGLSNQERKLWE